MSLRRIKRTFHRHLRPDRHIVVSPPTNMSWCDPCVQCSNDVQTPTSYHLDDNDENNQPKEDQQQHHCQQQHLQQRRSVSGTNSGNLPHPTLPSGSNHVERSSCSPCACKNVVTRSSTSHVNTSNKNLNNDDDNDSMHCPACPPFPHQPQQQKLKSKQKLFARTQGQEQTQTNGATMHTTTVASDHPLSWKRFVNHHQVLPQGQDRQPQGPLRRQESLAAQDQDQMTLSAATTVTVTAAATASSVLGPRLPPYYVSCFSPLDLPVDVFVYLLDFLSPGDLWRLCQVSSTMAFEVRRYMTGPQRFGFEAVKILYRRDELEVRAEMEAEMQRELERTEQEERLARLSVSSSPSPSPAPMRPTYNGHLMPYHGHYHQQQQQQQQRLPPLSPLQQHCYHLRSNQAPSFAHSPLHRSPAMESRKLVPTRSESRSTYWSSQATRFLNLMAKGLPIHSITSSLQKRMLEKQVAGERDHEDEDRLDNGLANERYMMLSPRISLISSPSSTSPSMTTLHSGRSSPSPVEANDFTGEEWRGSLPLKRFRAIVDLLFDPNLVVLHHRRAVINCARYVTASIEDGFGKASKIQDPVDATFAVKMHQDCSVSLGPFLHILSPVVIVQTSNSSSSSASNTGNSSVRRTVQSVVKPPTRMSNYFQLMLWHRCLSDLIALYNRIQRHHSCRTTLTDLNRTPVVLPTPLEAPLPQLLSSPSVSNVSLPAAPRAQHSSSNINNCSGCSCMTVIPSQYPYTIVPNAVRNRFRVAIQKLWSSSSPPRRRHRSHRRPLLCLGTVSSASEESPASSNQRGSRRGSQSKGSSNTKRVSCPHGVHRAMLSTEEDVNPLAEEDQMDCELHQKQQLQQQQEQLRRALEEEALVYQQYRAEERVRQDNLLKQELLSLCHMACGLFLSDDNRSFPLVQAVNQPQELRSARTTPTIMTLLREQGPWSKGVWREGEWRRSPVQVEDEIDEISISAHQQQQESSSPSPSSSFLRANKTESIDDQGPWQRLCLATIDFLSSESLYWGGNQTNAELSKLRAASLVNAWIYHE